MVETVQAIDRHQGRLAAFLQYKSMFEMAKAMGENDGAARVMRMMKDYNRAHPPQVSFHPSHNPAAVLYPQFTLGDFVCHLYVHRPAYS
jgi:hypothetical protein